ncbi:MAG: hypothetical protein ACI8RT_000671, partial [Candidatus Azotimanducaceae bacterium]
MQNVGSELLASPIGDMEGYELMSLTFKLFFHHTPAGYL